MQRLQLCQGFDWRTQKDSTTEKQSKDVSNEKSGKHNNMDNG